MDATLERRPAARVSRGFSLVETCAVLLSVSVLMAASVAVFKHTTQARVKLEAGANLKNFGQQATNNIKFHVQQSRTIFQNDTYGTSLWGSMNFNGLSPIAGTALPTIKETGSLSPGNADDATTPFDSTAVGNALLFTESMGHITINGVWVDLYQPRAYYLTKSTGMKIGGQTYSLELIEWVGKLYPDYSELLSYPASVGAGLYSRGYTQAWNSLATTTATTVYSISAAGGLTAVASPNLSPVRTQSATHLFENAGDTKYSIAFNSATLSMPDPVPSYAVASGSGDGFPNGFEVAVVGPTGGRKTLVRTVLMADGYGGRYSNATVVLASSRNF